MFHLHKHASATRRGIVGIVFVGSSGGYGAKGATPGTYIAQNHKRSRTSPPALAHVGAVTAFANGVELMALNSSGFGSLISHFSPFHFSVSGPMGSFTRSQSGRLAR